MHNVHAIGQFMMVIAAIIGIFINIFFVWLYLLISGLRTNFWGKLQLSAAGVVPVMAVPGVWGIVISFGLIAYLARAVTDAESWGDSLKYLGAQVVVGIVLALAFFKLATGTFDPVAGMAGLSKKAAEQSASREIEAPPETGSSSSKDRDNTYGLTPEELAEIKRQVDAPLKDFKKR